MWKKKSKFASCLFIPFAKKKIGYNLKYSNETKITALSVVLFVASVTIGVILVAVKSLGVSEITSSDKWFPQKKFRHPIQNSSNECQNKNVSWRFGEINLENKKKIFIINKLHTKSNLTYIHLYANTYVHKSAWFIVNDYNTNINTQTQK